MKNGEFLVAWAAASLLTVVGVVAVVVDTR